MQSFSSKTLGSFKLSRILWCVFSFFISLAAFAAIAGCNRASSSSQGNAAWVSAPEAVLRDRVATVYSKTGMVRNGERVQVLEKMQKKPFVRVRSARGEEGWIQERFLVDQPTYDQLTQLAEHFKAAPVQATAVIRTQANLHVTPGRKTEHLYLLNENDKVDLLQRQIVDRNGTPQPPKEPAADASANDEPPDPEAKAPVPLLEDWWLVRDSQKRVGWVRGHMLYVDVPVDVAQYAEGQRIVAFFKLDEVDDHGKKIPEYLILLTENKDGLAYDFDQVRTFVWNTRRHRYEAGYRDRHLFGVLPAAVGSETFPDEGTLRTFSLRLQDSKGAIHEQKFKYKPPRVLRVLAPGEDPATFRTPVTPRTHRPKKRRAR
jgi:SH3-like domain-containing protein